MDKNVMDLRRKQWLDLFEQQAQSGLTKEAWCKQHGINRGVFYRWQKECRKFLLQKNNELSCGSSNKTDPTVFVELPSVPESHGECCKSLSVQNDIHISHKDFTVSISSDVDEADLIKVLRALSYVYS